MEFAQESWAQLAEGTKLLVMLLVSGFMIYRATKAEGMMVVPLLMAAFAAMAYVIVLALNMV